MEFQARISLLILCQDDLPFDESGVVKSPAITVLSMSAFRYLNICFLDLGACMLGTYKHYL